MMSTQQPPQQQQQQQQQQQLPQLTSTTAPGKVFNSRKELADHYKSDWHKYNLKRREMNMTMLPHDAFRARLEAALALREERQKKEERLGKDHLKDKNKKKNKNKKNQNGEKEKTNVRKMSKRMLRQQEKKGIFHNENKNGGGGNDESMSNSNSGNDSSNNNNVDSHTQDEHDDNELEHEQEQEQEEEPPIIDPKQSLFDKKIFPTVEENIDYMYKTYGFFIPDVEYLVDKTGLIGYCAEKIKLGHTCLYSQKTFKSWRACQKHMIDSRHCKIRYESGVDLEEFAVFYDFTEDDQEFLASGIGNHKKKKKVTKKDEKVLEGNMSEKFDSMNVDDDDMDDDDDNDSGEWEDIDTDDDEEMDEDDGLYAAYQDEIAQHGLDITPLGELIFPDGRIIGHRGLNRYYKQRIALQDSRASVVAARRANGEQLFDGRVYDTYNGNGEDGASSGASAMELVKAGLTIGATRGRQGRGILVSANGSTGGASYTALSLYRYKAAVKKARKEEFKGRKLQQRTTLPMNKMDKKWNRLHNNVSVAHAPR